MITITYYLCHVIITKFDRTQKFVGEISELRAISGHVLGAAEVQIPENNLDNLHSSIEKDGTLETVDLQDLLGSFLLAGCDPLALVDKFTPVEDNIGLLETTFNEVTVLMFVFPEDVTGSINLTRLVLFIRVTTISLSPKSLMYGQEIFQSDNSFSQQSVLSFDQLFEIKKLNAQSQEKDMVIKKLKERIKSLSGTMKEDKIKQEQEEIETINIELDHRVSKLIAENEQLNRPISNFMTQSNHCIRSKEQCDDLIKQVNLKSAENSDLNASIQEQVLVITALKDNLRKLKGKAVADETVISHPIDPELLKVDVRIVLKIAKITKIRKISTQDQKPQRKAGSGSKFSSNNLTMKPNLSKVKV
nr:hypothetical protein [Tanacetum cinerariifolium]